MQTHSVSTVIFSLTDNGKLIGERLSTSLPACIHHHRPDDFAETARQAFENHSRCVFICSTGIVVRILAPVLKNKHQDPPVVVLDEHGKFVIPLLSGHEGGASAFGYQVATLIGAQLVTTSATDYSQPIFSVGVGSDRGCPAEMIEELFRQSVAELREPVEISAIASIDLKQNEAGILHLAQTLCLPLISYSAEQLRNVEDQLSTRSEIVFKEVGCYGVAEAAALLAASAITGNPAELVITKRKNSRSTVSVARSYR